MKKYREFIVTAEPFNPEVLSSVLWDLDIEGLYEDVNCVRIYVQDSSAVKLLDVTDALRRLREQNMIFSFNAEESIVQDKNWNEEWEKSINIINVSNKIVIKPTFREYVQKPGEIVITIDPKMSFGTGEHQTTKLVLRLLEKYVSPGIKVLDVGSGTGVLAIASIKFGASSAIAVDNDEWCFDNAKENSSLNNVDVELDVRIGEIKDIFEKDFDLITANIQKNILLTISEEISSRVKEDGIVILSGLLEDDENDIIRKYSEAGMQFLEKMQMDEWIALVFRKHLN